MGQKMSITSRRDLIRVTYERYQKAKAADKRVILDEFVAATCYHRKYAIEVLRHPPSLKPRANKRRGKPRYSVMVKQALVCVWKSANRICGKRLIPFLPELLGALEKHGEISLEPQVKEQLLKISPATADRLLRAEKRSLQPRGKCTTKPGTLLRRQIPVRTFADWNEQRPGFVEVDLVAHCDDDASGEFLHSLVMTDVMTQWTECAAVLNKGQRSVFSGIERVRRQFPFPMLGIDSDNGSEFINGHLYRYCQGEKITFTRCRPYKKNDQCHVEQKNWSIVRRMVGYDRYEGETSRQALEELYQKLRLYENFFQPCMKLISKERVTTSSGSRVKKRYDSAKTPYQRVLESQEVSQEHKEQLRKQYESLNPRALLREIEALQERVWGQAKIYRRQASGEKQVG